MTTGISVRLTMVLACSLLALAGCQSDRSANGAAPSRTGRIQSRFLADDVTPCFADAAPIGIDWLHSAGEVKVFGQKLGADITNHMAATVDVEIDIIATGLGGMEIRLPWTTLSSVAGSTVERVRVDVSAIPIRSHGAEATLRLAARYLDELGDPQEIVSQPLVFESAEDFQSITVLGEHGKPVVPREPWEVFPLDGEGRPMMTSEEALDLLVPLSTAPVTGQFADDGVTFLDWNEPAGLKATAGVDLRWGQVFSEIIDGLIEIGPTYGEQYVCFQSGVQWIDENRKVGGVAETVQSVGRRFPARYHWITILPIVDDHLLTAPIFNGPLNEEGCADLPYMAPGTYTVWTFNRLKTGAKEARVFERVRRHDDPFSYVLNSNLMYPSDTYPLGESIAVVVGGDGQMPSNIKLGNLSGYVSSVSAVYGQALFSADSGFKDNTVYRAYANESCPPNETLDEARLEACFSAGTKTVNDNQGRPVVFPPAVYLGYDFSPLPGSAGHNADWKYVTAHEIGHQVQHEAMGSWFFKYDRVDASFPQLCGCAGLNPSGNTLHCLQSTERQGSAQLEGYAHAFAGNVWNSRADSECVFTYYKGFRRPDLGIDSPPAAKSCITAARWGETYCPVTERSTEYDWLGFYTGVARGSAALDHADLSNVYRRMCTGSPATNCAGQVSTWSGLQAAADAEFGLGTLKSIKMGATGDEYGVTR